MKKKILKISLKNILKDEKLIEEYIKYIINIFYKYENIECTNYIIALLFFHPLPNRFVTDNYINDNLIIEESDNILVFKGKEGENRILFGNRNLSDCSVNPIPFTFPVKINDKYELLNSNIFYFEIEILENHRNQWSDETIGIGYGNINLYCNTNPGWKNESFGYHLDDGSLHINGKCIKNFGPIFKQGDIFGAGIIFLNDNLCKPFFTVNGYMISDTIELIKFNYTMTPIIGFDSSFKIKYNFGKSEFNFDIKSIMTNNSIISNNNIFIRENTLQKYYYNNNTNKIKKKVMYNNTIQNLINLPFITILNSSITENTMNEANIQAPTAQNNQLSLLFSSFFNNIVQDISSN